MRRNGANIQPCCFSWKKKQKKFPWKRSGVLRKNVKQYRVLRQSPPDQWRRKEAAVRPPPLLRELERRRPGSPSGPVLTRRLWPRQRCRAAALRWRPPKNLLHCATAREGEEEGRESFSSVGTSLSSDHLQPLEGDPRRASAGEPSERTRVKQQQRQIVLKPFLAGQQLQRFGF